MSDWGYPSGQGRLSTFAVASPTANNTINTKGLYFQLIASTAFDACGLLVQMRTGLNVVGTVLGDIAVGAAASEQVIVPNLLIGHDHAAGTDLWSVMVFVPVQIPAGSRLSCRTQSSSSAAPAQMAVSLVGGSFLGGANLGRVTTYGAATATSSGTIITAPSSGNGSYAQLTASCNAIKGLFGLVTMWARSQVWAGTLDIAVGGAGSEQIVIPSVQVICRGTSSFDVAVSPQCIPYMPISIPAGSRLSARMVFGVGAANDISLALYGVE